MAQQSVSFLLFVSTLLQLQTTWGFASSLPDKVQIIGGDAVSIEAAPFMAALFLGDRQVCGAAVIDDQFVLTAARCLSRNAESSGNWSVLVGSEQLNSDGLLTKVDKVLCHEEFDINTGKHDICLLKLTEYIPFGCLWTVNKLSLPTESRYIAGGTLANVTGWGYTENDGIFNELRQATVPVVRNECCRRINPNVTDDMICAGSKGHHFCSQDAGAPLTYDGMVIGVASRDAEDCSTYLTLYTKVTSYLSWIFETINNNQ